MSGAVIRPVLLVPDKNVVVEYKETQKPNSMGVVCLQNNVFHIVIERAYCMKNYALSWLMDKITFDEFLCGILLHEVAHIKYNSFDQRLSGNKKHDSRGSVWSYIDNVMEDARIEYRLSFEHPVYAQYLRWVLSALRVELNSSEAQMEPNVAGDVRKLQKYLQELFAMARFGLIEEDYDKAFARLAIPLIYSAMRGDRTNAVHAVDVIYDYLSTKIDMTTVERQMQIVTVVMTREAIDELLKWHSASGDEESAGNTILRILVEGASKERENATDNNNGYGRLAGSCENELILEDKDNAFYRSTVENYGSVIGRLRRMFKRLFESIKFDRDYDGEIDMRYQQNIYINSFIADCPTKDYRRISRVQHELDVVVIRDVSGSTSAVKDAYAAAVICLLASIDNLSNVRSAAIDFSGRHRVTKWFDSKLCESAIYPVCAGDTVIGSALNEIERWTWKAKNKLVFIITDGAISDGDHCAEQMKRMRKLHNINFQMIDVGSHSSMATQVIGDVELTHSTIEQLPETIAAKIMRRFETK